MNQVKLFFQKHLSILILMIAFVIAAVNYLVYPTFISKELHLIDVPVARDTISSSTRITSDLLTTISISKEYLPDNVITDESKLLNKYIQTDYSISKNGFFYEESVTSEETLKGKIIHQLRDGETAFVLEIDDKYDKDYSFKVGQSIDLYYRTKIIDSDGFEKTLVGKLKDLAKIVSISNSSSGKICFSVSLEEDEVSTFLIAEETGEIIPLLSIDPSCQVYDVNFTKSYLLDNGFVLYQNHDTESFE